MGTANGRLGVLLGFGIIPLLQFFDSPIVGIPGFLPALFICLQLLPQAGKLHLQPLCDRFHRLPLGIRFQLLVRQLAFRKVIRHIEGQIIVGILCSFFRLQVLPYRAKLPQLHITAVDLPPHRIQILPHREQIFL